jgi:hypothetical protein
MIGSYVTDGVQVKSKGSAKMPEKCKQIAGVVQEGGEESANIEKKSARDGRASASRCLAEPHGPELLGGGGPLEAID